MPSEPDDDRHWHNDDSDESPDEGFEYDDEPTKPCPYCRREIHEDSERCPYCENYISTEDAPPAIKPLWIIVAASLSLFAICWWIAK